MSDAFQAALTQITRVLKASPGSPTVENLLRLASIYKFETFRERIENNLSRISIAGQILVIDIDFEERPTQSKGQTRFHLHTVKLILANNEASFKDVNSSTGESVLKNSLTMYPDLGKFDLCLERLAAIDQHSIVEQGLVKVDCFEFVSDTADYFMKTFPGQVVINPANEFCFELLGKFKVYLQEDERMSTAVYTMPNGSLTKSLHKGTDDVKTMTDVGFRVEALHGFKFPILKHLITEFSLVIEEEETKVELPDIDNTYKSKKHTTIQLFYLFQSEMVSISGFQCGDLLNVVKAIDTMTKLHQICKVVDVIKENTTLVDRFTDMETEAVKLSDFFKRVDGATQATDDKMEVDKNYLTINASETEFEIQGNQELLVKKVEFADPTFETQLQEVTQLLEEQLLY